MPHSKTFDMYDVGSCASMACPRCHYVEALQPLHNPVAHYASKQPPHTVDRTTLAICFEEVPGVDASGVDIAIFDMNNL
jgi:hypothetical protein